MRTKLLFCAPAPIFDAPQGFLLDVKFVEGMRAHVASWEGPVQCILWRGARSQPFGRAYTSEELGFELTVLDTRAPVPRSAFSHAALAMVSADQPGFADIVRAARRATVPVVASLEYTLETRLQIIRLDQALGLVRQAKRMLSTYLTEYQMRRALRVVSSVQFNGYPSFDTYGRTVQRPLLYLDNRMSPALMATPKEMAARAAQLRAGTPLRLIHSGRLEPMKGAQDLLGVMQALRHLGVRATLDIYGTGSLESEIRAGQSAFDGAVRLHGPVDFEKQLVPASRMQADIFLSCHRQSDPSCTYLEAMGCGLAIAGYDNRMWSRLSAEAGLGAVAPLGQPMALAALIADWNTDREALIIAAQRGLAFASDRHFIREFDARMAHAKTWAAHE